MVRALNYLKSNDYLPKETFEQYLQKISQKRQGKKVFFARNDVTDLKDKLYADYLHQTK